ncbi:hypothetical protein [Sphingomonas morindae]|uniref:Uncharacterized protein n=1 Tax=Sphingomonas morindae TaxID=1541170 RepID=A0ABY4X4J1_9SPHN|nr:hypothetical protein [Sphingomonas morindae]USI71808.1 hypothetical protein LHA26_10790 [Sphingomonas morindae]
MPPIMRESGPNTKGQARRPIPPSILAAAPDAEARRQVRGELCRRLDVLEAGLGQRDGIAARLEAQHILALAAEQRLTSAARLAEGLAAVLRAGGRGAAIQPWIDRLRDAIGCEAEGAAAGDAWMASVMVRLAC